MNQVRDPHFYLVLLQDLREKLAGESNLLKVRTGRERYLNATC